MRRLGTAGLVLALLGSACAPDQLDTYRAPSVTDSTTASPSAATVERGESTSSVATIAAEATPTFPPNGTTVEVRALDNSFVAPVVEIDAGTEVRWVNGGRNDHNVLPVDDGLAWGVERDEFAPTEDYAHVFDQPGVYPYYCSIHGTKEAGMVGAVVVAVPN